MPYKTSRTAGVGARRFPVPTTSEQAEVFLRGVLGIRLYRPDGVGRGETKGEIVGYNCIKGTNNGGMDEPLPLGVTKS